MKKKVNLYESDVYRYFIDEECTFMDEEHLTELSEELIEEFKDAEKRFQIVQDKIYQILKSRRKT